MPVAAFSTSTMIAGSNPKRWPISNASIPITTVVGITITSLFALSAVVEQAFNLNGIGAALVQAALSKDFAVVQGISLVLVAAFVILATVAAYEA